MALGMRPVAPLGAGVQRNVGMYLRDSTSGKIEFWAVSVSAATVVYSLWAAKLTNATTFSATRQAANTGLGVEPKFLEIEYDGTNYYFRVGWGDDSPLQQQHTNFAFAKTNFLTAAADGIGLFSENDQSLATTLICRGFYRVPTSSVL